MPGCRTIRFICIASLLAAMLLPTAEHYFASRPANMEHSGTACFLSTNYNQAPAVYVPQRNPQQDLRDFRLSSALPVAVGTQSNFDRCVPARTNTDKKHPIAPTDVSLLSMHCLLLV